MKMRARTATRPERVSRTSASIVCAEERRLACGRFDGAQIRHLCFLRAVPKRGGEMVGETATNASLDPFGYATHEVLNQPPPLADYDAFGSDPVLQKIVVTFDADWARERLQEAWRSV